MKLSLSFFENSKIQKLGKGFMGGKIVILWMRILLLGGIPTESKRDLRKKLKVDIFTFNRGLRLFRKLNMINDKGQIIDSDENRKKYKRQYMRAYRNSIPKDNLIKVVKRLKKQVNIENFGIKKTYVEEFVLIMAEVMSMEKNTKIFIDGVMTTAEDVSLVYSKLTFDHMNFALERYMAVEEKIVRVKDYLRTLLYNAYFEMGPAITNEIKSNS